MKSVLKSMALLLTALLLFSCTKQNAGKENSETVTEIEWKSYGGITGYSETKIFTGESVIHEYKQLAHNEAKIEKIDISDEEWNDLVSTLDLTVFATIKDGQSEIHFDGIDELIVIKTTKGEYKNLNGFNRREKSDELQEFVKLLRNYGKILK